MTYFDTAYMLKCYVEEPGWEQVRAFAGSCERIACSVYGRLELHAALHRKLREERLSERGLDVVLRQLNVDESVGLWEWLPSASSGGGAARRHEGAGRDSTCGCSGTLVNTRARRGARCVPRCWSRSEKRLGKPTLAATRDSRKPSGGVPGQRGADLMSRSRFIHDTHNA
jgi:hypothetical protein